MMRTLLTRGAGPKVWAATPVAISAITIIEHTRLRAGRGKQSLAGSFEGNISPGMDAGEVTPENGVGLRPQTSDLGFLACRMLEKYRRRPGGGGVALSEAEGAGVLARRAKGETPSGKPARGQRCADPRVN